MEYKINYKFGWTHNLFDATPCVIVGATSAQNAVDIIARRAFFKSVDRVQERECIGIDWVDCVDWTQPTIEARGVNAITEILPCEQ